MMRPLFFVLGLLMTALGIIGAFVPLMPTTIFLILAAWFFARSSTRFEAWLLNHPRFGKTLRDWQSSGAISRRAKIMALSGMTLGMGIFYLGAHPRLWLLLLVGAIMAACAWFVASRPEPQN
jgi:uncharacterized membrane protein YbaN (DUF454 family)